MLLLIHKFDWRIILVNKIYYEDGGKIPLKSISVKPMVLASYAQFGVSAGRKNYWATAMACVIDPVFMET